MTRTYDNAETFYKDAMINITHQLGNKLRALGVDVSEIPELIGRKELNRYTSQLIDGIILEMYEYKGIRLIEVEWSKDGIKQRDINKDEREIRGNNI